MKKFYSFFALLMCTFFSLTATAQTDSKAYLFLKGSFYYVTLQSDANPRVEASVYGDQAGTYTAVEFNSATDNPFNIKSQNQDQSFFVYKNGVAVENSQEGVEQQMFNAQTTLANNDVVKVFSVKPMQTTLNVGFMNGEFGKYAAQVEVTMDKVQTIANLTSEISNVLEGTEFQVKAKEGYEIASVTYCNNEIAAVDGVYTFAVNEENPLVNITMKEKSADANAAIYFNGSKFYTFSIQDKNAADPRQAEIFSEVLAGASHDKYVGLNVNNGMDVRFVGQAQDNAFFVYVNGVKLASEQENMFEASAYLAANSIVKVYDAEPANLTLNFGFMNQGPIRELQSKVVVTKDMFLPVADLSYAASVMTGTQISIKAAEGSEIASVTYCNEEIQPVDGVYTFQVYNDNTLVNIELKEAAKTATAYVDGQFYTITATDADHQQALSVMSGTYADYFPFAPGNYTLQAYNEANEFHVYLDNVPVQNTVEAGSQGFKADVEIKDGNVLKFFNAAPFTSKVEFGFMQPRAEVASQVEVIMDKTNAVDVTVDQAVNALKGTEFAIKAKEGYEIAQVIVNNEPIYPNDGVYTAKVATEGDTFIIIDMKDNRNTAVAYLNGTIYTATVSDPSVSDPRQAEVLNVTYQEGYDEYREIKFNQYSNTFIVKATTPNNEAAVYVDGVKVASTAEEGNPFEAQVTLNNNSVLKIYDAEPFTSNVEIGFMGGRAKDAQKVVVTADQVTVLDVAQDVKYNVLAGTEFAITTKKGYGYEIKSVTVNNTPVYPSGDVYKVKASQAGDMLINIEMVSDEKQAQALIDGEFYTFTATAADDESGRDQVIDVTYGTYASEYRTFNFVPGKRYNLKGMNPGNTIVVYLNGVEVPSTGLEGEMYEAQVEFSENDVLKVYSAAPFYTKMMVSFMQPRQQVADQVEVSIDKVKAVSAADLKDEATSAFPVLKGTAFTIKAKEGYQIAGVTYCNESVYPDYNNVYTVNADREGDAMIIIDMMADPDVKTAVAYIKGDFYTFTATPAASESSRDQVLDVTYGSYDEYREISFKDAQNPFNLKGMNQGNEFYVYLNGVKLESTGIAGEMYERQINLQEDDVLKVYTQEPFTTNMSISFMQQRAEVAKYLSVYMDGAQEVTGLDVDQAYAVLEGTIFKAKAAAGAQVLHAYINNEEIFADANGVYTFVASQAGDMMAIFDIDVYDPTGISSVNADVKTNKIYTIQGMEVKDAKAGLYIINGKKVVRK